MCVRHEPTRHVTRRQNASAHSQASLEIATRPCIKKSCASTESTRGAGVASGCVLAALGTHHVRPWTHIMHRASCCNNRRRSAPGSWTDLQQITHHRSKGVGGVERMYSSSSTPWCDALAPAVSSLARKSRLALRRPPPCRHCGPIAHLTPPDPPLGRGKRRCRPQPRLQPCSSHVSSCTRPVLKPRCLIYRLWEFIRCGFRVYLGFSLHPDGPYPAPEWSVRTRSGPQSAVSVTFHRKS